MKSHCYKKYRGQGAFAAIRAREFADNLDDAPATVATPVADPSGGQTTPSTSEPSLFCQHVTHAGRRCRMLRAENHTSFCAYHAQPRKKRTDEDSEALADELFAAVEDFSNAENVSIFLENVVRQYARKRITRADAIAFGYLSQLHLNCLSAMEKEIDSRNADSNFRALFPQTWAALYGPKAAASKPDESKNGKAEVERGAREESKTK
jgi:hypothetical protein